MSNRVDGERVFCYQCENEWDRAHGGLQCPRCGSEFVEILSPGSRPDIEDPPEVAPDTDIQHDDDSPFQSLRDHRPWGSPPPDPDEGDIRTVHFNTGGGGNGTFSFSRTYTTSFGGGPRQQSFNSGNTDPAADEIMRNFQGMVSNILGGHGQTRGSRFGGAININGRTTTFGSGTHDTAFPSPMGPPDMFSMIFPGAARGPGQRPTGSPFDMLSMLLDPRNARSGDAVFSQEAFDRVMSQLMEQNQQNGAPPASADLISQLPKKKVDRTMFGDDGKAECSICMDNVDIDTEVTVLPCKHWFHFECIQSWLEQHDTCPHCRKPITPEDQRNQQSQGRPAERRRPSRRSSSVASPFSQMPQEGSRQNPHIIPDSPSGIRAAREQYYGANRPNLPRDRPSSERRSSRRSTGDDGGGAGVGGGVGGWIRSHMPFS